MIKRTSLLSCVLVVCVGMMCSINGDLRFVETETLDQVDATLTISQAANASQATVEAVISDGPLTYVNLKDDQAVEVDGTALSRSSLTGRYSATVNAADQYTVTVREPTIGVHNTTITAPADFIITSPLDDGTASLSGFTITWSNADGNLQVEVALTQRILGETRTLILDPVQDTGNMAVGAQALADARFGQGADLTVTVTKVNELGAISGFRSGTLQARRAKLVVAQPGS